ncbi:maleylpyruvate isomerase family mycothiol-dependent enzyme [Nonomuraea fuscirosea]|uniref:maleylpyruvate isomerase family mycothiol-dependent enzyme n=1 Tax=Nonomuraea fuscirosea TaxID=1291556 RepID=UPI003431CC0F
MLPARVREVAVLTTGARHGAAYELYSHSRVAAAVGLPDDVVADLVAGRRPAGLSRQEAVAYDVAAGLHDGGPLPATLYRAAVGAFGETGMVELVFLIAQYAGISLLAGVGGPTFWYVAGQHERPGRRGRVRSRGDTIRRFHHWRRCVDPRRARPFGSDPVTGTKRTRADSMRWLAEGTTIFFDALATMPDERLDGPSALDGWSGRHLLAHVAANADALANLASWARTGEERPMYASREQRDADIEAGAKLPAAELRAWAVRASGALAARLAELDEQQWSREVRTSRGQAIPASEVPWMRAREFMVHAVDLDAGVTFDDLPAGFLAALVDDISASRSGAGGPTLTLTATDHDGTWTIGGSDTPTVAGSGAPVEVTGTLAGLAAYLSGRRAHGVTGSDGGPAPQLPGWL